MDAMPNTVNYLIGGYLVFAVLMAVYIVSLMSRWNNLKREKQMLDEIDSQKK
jgi:hypothetical protein